MRNTPFNLRDNEFYGDMAAYLQRTAADNEADLRRLKRNLRHAREEVLTERQRLLLRMHYEENRSVSEIARTLHVNKSTVSRTLARARERLKRCLRYGL